MNPSFLIPSPDSIPVPWGWFKFFLTLTFMLHILFMNVMVGTAIISFFGHMKRESGASYPVEKDLSRKLTFIIAFTVNLGVAPLLFVQVLYGQFVYVSSILMAVYWLALVGLLIIAYYSAYYYKFKFDTLKSGRAYFIGVTALILIFIGFLFTNNMSLMLKPDIWLNYFDSPDGTLLNLSDPTVLPRFLHFMTGAVAVGGLFIAILWSLKEKKGVPGAGTHIQRGLKWFNFATMIEILIGFWFLMSLPREIMLLFMGGSMPHTTLLVISLGLTALALVFGIYQKVAAAAGTALVLIFSMIIMRDMVRTAYLSPFFQVSDLTVIPQYSPLILFLVSLSVGAGIVIYVIRLAVTEN